MKKFIPSLICIVANLHILKNNSIIFFLLPFILGVEINNIILTLIIRLELTLQVNSGLELVQV